MNPLITQLILTTDVTPEVLAQLEAVGGRRYAVEALVPPEHRVLLRQQARYSGAHTSTVIEGNPLTIDAAMAVLVDGPSADVPAELEIANLEEAYQFVNMLGTDKSLVIDQGLVRAFHSQTLKGLPDTASRNRGKYRAGQNLIVDAATRAVRYLPPPATIVPDLMAGLVEAVNGWRTRYPGPVTAAMAHFGLVSIHPFDDGNGRVARLLADLVLALEDWSCDGMLTVNPLLLENRSAYYDVLRQVQGERFQPELDVTPFVEFHTRQLAAALQRLEERAHRFRRELDGWTTLHPFLNQRQITALMFMQEIGPLSTSKHAELTESSPATALTDLAALVRAGLATRNGAGPRTRYRIVGTALSGAVS